MSDDGSWKRQLYKEQRVRTRCLAVRLDRLGLTEENETLAEFDYRVDADDGWFVLRLTQEGIDKLATLAEGRT